MYTRICVHVYIYRLYQLRTSLTRGGRERHPASGVTPETGTTSYSTRAERLSRRKLSSLSPSISLLRNKFESLASRLAVAMISAGIVGLHILEHRREFRLKSFSLGLTTGL